MEHTKEPWICNSGWVYAEDGHLVADCRTTGITSSEDANARRIAACVNACAGIDTELLEITPGLLSKSLDRVAEFHARSMAAEQQRDKLQAALSATVAQRDELALIIATDTGTESAVAELQKQRDKLLSACEGVIAWDEARNYAIPYRVRDPIHSAIASVKCGANTNSEQISSKLVDGAKEGAA